MLLGEPGPHSREGDLADLRDKEEKPMVVNYSAYRLLHSIKTTETNASKPPGYHWMVSIHKGILRYCIGTRSYYDKRRTQFHYTFSSTASGSRSSG
jgi:hypothetical protein